MNNLPQKKHRALLWKKYFTGDFKLVKVKKSLWDALPEDCKAVVFEKRGLNKCAAKIQLHYRKVRYSPDQLKALRWRGRVRCATSNMAGRKVVIQWHPSTGRKFEVGDIAWGKKATKKYDCVVFYNMGNNSYLDGYGNTITYPVSDIAYWYNPKSCSTIAISDDPRIVVIRNTHNILSCVPIKPW